MEINKRYQQKEKDRKRLFLRPNYSAVLGLIVDKKTHVEDGFEEESEQMKVTVKQKIKDLIFETEELVVTDSVEEHVERKIKLAEGTRLVWVQGRGYIVPEERFQTIEEIKDDVDSLQGI